MHGECTSPAATSVTYRSLSDSISSSASNFLFVSKRDIYECRDRWEYKYIAEAQVVGEFRPEYPSDKKRDDLEDVLDDVFDIEYREDGNGDRQHHEVCNVVLTIPDVLYGYINTTDIDA